MSNELTTTPIVIELALAVLGIIVPIAAVCLFAGKISIKIKCLELREQDFYTTIREDLGTLEKQAASLRAKAVAVKDEIRELRLAFR